VSSCVARIFNLADASLVAIRAPHPCSGSFSNALPPSSKLWHPTFSTSEHPLRSTSPEAGKRAAKTEAATHDARADSFTRRDKPHTHNSSQRFA
jgi:hypothetical protein